MTRSKDACRGAARGGFARRLLLGSALGLALLLGLGVVLGPPRAAADDLAAAVPSLKLVPQDAAIYSAMLNGREQIEIIARSNFWKQVQLTDFYKQAMAALAKAQDQPESQLSQALGTLALPENQQALGVVREMVSDEVFLYGNADLCDAMQVFSEVGNSIRFGNFFYEFSDHSVPPEEFMARQVLNTLNSDLGRLKVPDVVVGFRIHDKAAAEAQLHRLEVAITKLMDQIPPQAAQWKNQFQRQKVGDGEYLTFTIDGSLIPWDEMPLNELAEKPGQYDNLVKKLKGLKIVYALGIQRGYVVLSVGKSTDHLAALGKGPSLLDEPRLKVLRDKGAQRYTGVSYVSRQFADSTGVRPQDVDAWVRLAERSLPMTKLSAEEQRQILTDVKNLATELKVRLPKAGPMVNFSYLTPRGIEGYSYNWTEDPYLDGSKKLSITTHLGSSPLLAIAARRHNRPEDYDLLVRLLKKGRDYFEKYAVPTMNPHDQARYKQVAQIAYPLLARLDHVQRTMMIPALADGQIALVLDTHLKSKQWYEKMPETTEPAALPLPALVLGVSDVALLDQAMGEYRSIANDLVKKLRPFVPPNVPEFDIEPAKSKKISAGVTVYYYPLHKDFGIDKQLAPNSGVSPKLLVLSFSPKQTVDLLKSQTVAGGADGPLAAADRPAVAVVVFNWVQLVDAVRPWVDEGVRTYVRAQERAFGGLGGNGDDPADEKHPAADSPMAVGILKQVKQAAELLKAFRGVTAISTVEGQAVVTHFEARFQDVP